MTKVKICGITNSEDALYASDLGASFIGMIFYPDSPRFVTYETALKIVSSLPELVIPVGVFVNPTLEEVVSGIKETGIKAVQIHGTLNQDELKELKIIKIRAFGINDSFDFRSVSDNDYDYLLLDNSIKGQYGGTGKTFNWTKIPSSINKDKLILAGGLNPENIGEAIKSVKPAVVDVSSGVESSPGIKDKSKLITFFKSVPVRLMPGKEIADRGF